MASGHHEETEEMKEYNVRWEYHGVNPKIATDVSSGILITGHHAICLGRARVNATNNNRRVKSQERIHGTSACE